MARKWRSRLHYIVKCSSLTIFDVVLSYHRDFDVFLFMEPSVVSRYYNTGHWLTLTCTCIECTVNVHVFYAENWFPSGSVVVIQTFWHRVTLEMLTIVFVQSVSVLCQPISVCVRLSSGNCCRQLEYIYTCHDSFCLDIWQRTPPGSTFSGLFVDSEK